MKKYTNEKGEKLVVYKLNELPSFSPERVAEIEAIADDQIDTSDIPELDEEFWQNAALILPDSKERLTLRLDREVVHFFRRRGRGYQSRINAVLRAYVRAQTLAEKKANAQNERR